MLENKYIITILIIVLILYASGKITLDIIQDDVFKLVLLFVGSSMATQDVPLSILITVAGAVIIQSTTNKHIFDDVINKIKNLNIHKQYEDKIKKVVFDESNNTEFSLESDYDSIYNKVLPEEDETISELGYGSIDEYDFASFK